MPASLIASAFFAEGTVAYAATYLGVRILSTIAIGSLIAKDAQQDPGTTGSQGGKVQLPPATDNKLPVLYGTSWVSPIITDVKMSTDQQTMWYVLTLGEATDTGTVSIGNVYWDDKRLLFDPANPNKVWGWFIEGDSSDPADNTIVTGVGNKINMWFYRNGSNITDTVHHVNATTDPFAGSDVAGTSQTAISVLQDTRLLQAQQWGANHTMTNTVFCVVRVDYDQDHGITGLGNIKVEVKNTLKQPGSVIKDYLLNSRYGCGIALANIDQDALSALDTYSASNITGTSDGRYQINGIIDTGRDCLSNLVALADSADSWIQWNEAAGKWGVVINRSLTEAGGSTSTMRVVKMDNILGGITVTPLDLNNTYNSVNVQFPNYTIKDQTDYRTLEIAQASRAPNEPNNRLSLNLPLINNDVQATYIAWKRLYASRNDITINFTMDYSGIQIDAGDIIAIQHDWYGWVAGKYGDGTYPGKPFRVTQIRESKDNNGFLTAQITAIAYNDQDYIPGQHYATTQQFSGLTDPEYISKPTAPRTRYINTSSGIYWVAGDIPQEGNVVGMEFWYSVKGSELGANNYTLYSVQNYTNTALYPRRAADGTVFFEEIQLNSLPSGTYYWRTRAQGANTVSDFSDPSTALVWEQGKQIYTGTQIADNSLPGTKVTTGDPQKTGQAGSGGFFDTLGPIAGVALAGLAGYALYNKYGLPTFGSEEKAKGGGNDEVLFDGIYPKMWTTTQTDNKQAGDQVEYLADATPSQPPIEQNANFNGYDTDRWNVADGGYGGDFDFG
jgi:hypothetical protein